MIRTVPDIHPPGSTLPPSYGQLAVLNITNAAGAISYATTGDSCEMLTEYGADLARGVAFTVRGLRYQPRLDGTVDVLDIDGNGWG